MKMLEQAEQAGGKMHFLTVDFLGVPLAYWEEHRVDCIFMREARLSSVILNFFGIVSIICWNNGTLI